MENKKINKKAAGYMTNVLVSIILFGLAIIGAFYLYADIITESDAPNGYGYLNLTTDTRFQGLNHNATALFGSMTGESNNMQNDFTNSTSTQSSGADNMVTNSFSAVKNIFKNTFTFTNEFLGLVSTYLGIPRFFMQAFVAIMVIVIFIAALSGFMRATNW